MAGGAADCAAWIRDVATKTKLLEIDLGEEVGAATVARCSLGTGWESFKGPQCK